MRTNEEQKSYYWRNVDRLRAINRKSSAARFAKKRIWLNEIKSVACMDCGNRFPPECMDFDHARGTKSFEIHANINRGMETLMAELAKCDIVCANCHRIRTKARGVVGRPRAA